jgi:uncharacterized surface anchored protein
VVSLSGIDSQGNVVNTTTTTDTQGVYSFVGVKPGSYSVSYGTAGTGYSARYSSAGTE